jgi:RNA polymerase sigma factor (sigma-70 family)
MTSMAEPRSREPSDAELIRRTRDGDPDAYGALFARHADAATLLASRLTTGTPVAADDVVSDAFLGVLSAIRSGHGPEESFRPYLYTAVRNGAAALRERESRAIAVEDPAQYEKPDPAPDPAVTEFESEVVQRAFASLPERWQAVLWYHEVEAMRPAAIAPLLGLSANGVSALLLRAREGLREAYLVQHLGALDGARPECAWTAARLGAHVRGSLSRRDRRKVTAHLADCADCRAMAAEVAEVDRGLYVVIAPLIVGGAGAAWLATRRADAQHTPAAQGRSGGPSNGSPTAAARGSGWKAAPVVAVATAGLVVVAMVALAVTGVLGDGGETPAAPEPPAVVLPETDDATAAPETQEPTEDPDDASVDSPPDPVTDDTAPPARPPVVPDPSDEEEPPIDPVTEVPVTQTVITGVLTVLDADHPTLALAGPVQSATITWVTDQAYSSEIVTMETPGGQFTLPYSTLATYSLDDGTVQYIGTADATAMVTAVGDGQWTMLDGFGVLDWRLDVLQEGDEVTGVQLDGMFELAAGQEVAIPLVAPGSGTAHITTFDGSHPEATVVDGVLWIHALAPTVVKQIVVVFDS